MRHVYQCPLRWADLDPLQHVNNVKYLDYLQDARVDFLRTIAPGLRADAASDAVEALVVVAHDITYAAPLALHRSVDVECWISEVKAATFTISYEIVTRVGEQRVVHASASTVLTPFVFAEQRPRRLAAEERALLKGWIENPTPSTPLPPMRPHLTPAGHYDLNVRFSDVDAYGHVNNVTFLEYLQEGRIAFTAELRNQLEPQDRTSVVVARTRIEYVRQMHHRVEPYAVVSWIESIGNRSMVVESEIRDGDVVHARASVVLVFFDPETQRSAAPSAAMRALVESRVAPAGR
ncbi:acyl-CoA thioesterase [Nocardioides yefusunii]|uniref:Acyl-CoA thioesterase n=1 Tax=Nocardioides yefusunii TaxID=2500546 RepID=A0ABW1QVK3_9ACTN|nr:thioesterase family protein [Nocardioides yefusunii]